VYLKYFSKTLLLPSFIISLSIGNKGISLGSFNIAVIFTWIAIIFSMVIVFRCVKNQFLSLFLIASVFAFRVLEFISANFSIFYIVSVGLLYAMAAAILFAQNKDLIYKQIMFFTLINVFFQMLQLSGVWTWPYWFTTIVSPSQADILFVEYNDLKANIAQFRPTGILSSPTWQSLYTGLVIALHFTRKKVIPFSTFLVVLLIVLSNSKFPLLMLPITWIIIYFFGNVYQKELSNKFAIILIFVYLSYAFLFPGIAKMTFDPNLWAWSFFVRLNNLLSFVYPNGEIPIWLQIYTYGTAIEPGHEDNYFTAFAKINNFKQFVIFGIPSAFLFSIYYKNKYKNIKHITGRPVVFPLLCLVITVLYVIMFPILEAHFYYFIMGGALLPIFLTQKIPLFAARYF